MPENLCELSIPILGNHLQKFEVDRSTVRYRKKFVSSLLKNFKIFTKIFEKQKFSRFENFRALVEFLYCIVSYQFFWGRNEMVQWMVEILQVLTFNCSGKNCWFINHRSDYRYNWNINSLLLQQLWIEIKSSNYIV